MSRIGNRVLTIPAGVTVTVEGTKVTVKGPKGELTNEFDKNMVIEVNGTELTVKRPNDSIRNKTFHGTINSLIENMIIGVSTGFSRDLEINGVGYRVAVQGNKIELNVGFSHSVKMDVPADLKVEAPSANKLTVSGISKERVNQFAAEIRDIRPPEPYKGKGIKYADEHIRIKEGKKASK
ncbi:MAG: 50S ribosomal protein L6 [Bacilli bacterium]|nr:50S ribosomal protein L6 [Bacilli bacterium]